MHRFTKVNMASLMAQSVNNLPAMQDDRDRVRSLGQKDLLEKEMATHSSIILAVRSAVQKR